MLTRRPGRGARPARVGVRRSARDDGSRRGRSGDRPDRAAHAARRPAAPAARGQRGHPRGRRLGDPRLRVEDQPDGAGPGRLQGARRRRPAHPLRRRPTTTSASALLDAGPRRQQPRLVAPLRRRAARLVPVLPRPGGGRLADPHATRCSSSPACCRPRSTPARSSCSATARAGRRRSTAGSSLRMARQQLLHRARTRRSCGRWSTRPRCAARSAAPR